MAAHVGQRIVLPKDLRGQESLSNLLCRIGLNTYRGTVIGNDHGHCTIVLDEGQEIRGYSQQMKGGPHEGRQYITLNESHLPAELPHPQPA